MNKQPDNKDWTTHWGLAGDFGLTLDRVDVAEYTSPEVFEAEREAIYRRAWLPVGCDHEVASPGDFIRREIPPLATEALITRDRDGSLHAFHNACQHRGPAIVSECKGKTSAFTCPYHAWTYGLDGKLKGLPGKEYFPQAKIGETRLKPIHIQVWNGFIFLNFSDEPEQTLEEFLGDFVTLFDGVPFGDYPHILEISGETRGNWKSAVEASSEAYHVNVLHRQSLGEQIFRPENPLGNMYDPVFTGAQCTITVQANQDWRPSQPVMQFVYATEAFRAQPGGARDGEAPAGPRLLTDHPGVNRIDLPSMSTESLLLFPSNCIQLLTNRWIWIQYWPVAADRTRFSLRAFAPAAPASYREAFAEAHLLAYSRDIATEDNCMVARQHKSFLGGGVDEVLLGENEPILRFFHQVRREWLDREGDAPRA